jgi:hypothetical protein
MRSDSARCSTFLSRANKAPHYRICTLEYFRPDCESPARPGSFGKCRTICNHTITSIDVKRRTTLFFGAFHTPVEAVKIPIKPHFGARFVDFPARRRCAAYSTSTNYSLRLYRRVRLLRARPSPPPRGGAQCSDFNLRRASLSSEPLLSKEE